MVGYFGQVPIEELVHLNKDYQDEILEVIYTYKEKAQSPPPTHAAHQRGCCLYSQLPTFFHFIFSFLTYSELS